MKNHTAIRFGPTAIVLASTVACSWFGSDDSKKGEPVGPAVGGGSAGDAASTGGAGGGPTGGETGSAAGTSHNGDAGGGSTGCNALAGPAMVEVSSPAGTKYCIDRSEVTQADYAKFLAAAPAKAGGEHTACGSNGTYLPRQVPPGTVWEPAGDCVVGIGWTPESTPNRPVVCIDWCDAYAYCKWAGKRLCGKIGGGPLVADPGTINQPNPNDEAANALASQWYNACSQGGKTAYPYGNAYGSDACEGADNSAGSPKKDVGASPGCRGSTEPYSSIVDLSGSVQEFTDECMLDTTGPLTIEVCIARGGSRWTSSDLMGCRPYASVSRDRSEESFGFRCCKDY